MAPIDLRLGQNAFQVIPELSLFDVEDGNIFGFFGLDQFVLGRDTCVLGQDTCVLGQDTCVLGTRLGQREMCLGPRRMRPVPGFVHP